MPASSCAILPYSKAELAKQIGGKGPRRWLEYLHEYLTELQVQAIIAEEHYVDRHYLDDFSRYYARSFSPPKPHCRRLHFFAASSQDVDQAFAGAYGNIPDMSVRDHAQQQLQAVYQGFIVIRPLDGAPIGRAVLATYSADGGRRHFGVVRPYHVNLGGLHLVVAGLAYQQQDRGVAVCASTALWCALQSVAYVAGNRTPSPSSITDAAGSPYPASDGLTDTQMASALAGLGYIADAFVPGDNLSLFRAKVIACLESQLPVILAIHTPAGGHAICLTGFSELSSVGAVRIEGKRTIPMRGATASVVYAHDDNLGCHAHYELFEHTTGGPLARALGTARTHQMLRRGRTNKPPVTWWQPDECLVLQALVPKPEELRLSVDSLFATLARLRLVFETPFGGMALNYQVKFTAGIDFKSGLFGKGFSQADLRHFCASVSLPRHVAIISMLTGDAPLFDVVLDASEVERVHRWPPVLCFAALGIPKPTQAAIALQDISQQHFNNAPVLLMP